MKWTNQIELNIVFFGILLNFIWEVQQLPLFEMPEAVSLRETIRGCTQATLGDAVILLIAFWAVAIRAKSRQWFFSWALGNLFLFIATGLAITLLIEFLATEVLFRWQYGEAMPTLLLVGTGLLPVLQWLLLPPFVLWLVRRQLSSQAW